MHNQTLQLLDIKQIDLTPTDSFSNLQHDIKTDNITDNPKLFMEALVPALFTIEEIPSIETELFEKDETNVTSKVNSVPVVHSNSEMFKIKENIENTIQSNIKTTQECNKYPLKFSKDEIKEWAIKQELSQEIIEFLKDFNGETLNCLYCLKKEAPEYFYKTISNNSQIPFHIVAKFIVKLNQLFTE